LELRAPCPARRRSSGAVISDLLAGQFNALVRIVAFNTPEHWAEDVSQEVAEGIQTRCDIEGEPVPEYVRDFVESHCTGPQLMRGTAVSA
jgi:hypothetical protein